MCSTTEAGSCFVLELVHQSCTVATYSIKGVVFLPNASFSIPKLLHCFSYHLIIILHTDHSEDHASNVRVLVLSRLLDQTRRLRFAGGGGGGAL